MQNTLCIWREDQYHPSTADMQQVAEGPWLSSKLRQDLNLISMRYDPKHIILEGRLPEFNRIYHAYIYSISH